MSKGIGGIVAILIGLLCIAGCGGDSAISRAEYEQQVELVCNNGLKKREELLKVVSQEYAKRDRKASAREQAEEQADNIRKLMGVYRETTEELADIDLPEQGQQKAEEMVKAREDAVAKVEKDPRGGLAEFTTIFAKSNKIAEDFFEVSSCAR